MSLVQIHGPTGPNLNPADMAFYAHKCANGECNGCPYQGEENCQSSLLHDLGEIIREMHNADTERETARMMQH